MMIVTLVLPFVSVLLPYKDDSLLKGRIQLIEVNNNSVLGHEGDLVGVALFSSTATV